MFTSFKRVVKFAWQGFWRNRGLGFAVIFIMVVAVFLITSLFFFAKVSEFLIVGVQDKVDVSVYFKDNASEEEILALRDSLLQASLDIKSIDYVSKEKALEIFQVRHEKDPFYLEALEAVGANPFLASLSIKAPEAGDYARIAEFLESDSSSALIEKISYYQNKRVIERLFSLIGNIKNLGIFLSALLIILAAFLTFNTLKLTISSLRDEITTMRLVGASNFFIRGPFVLQSFIYGLFAVLIVNVILFAALPLLNSKIQSWFLDFDVLTLFRENFFLLLNLQVGLVIILGAVSSFLAVKKYLKV